MCLPFICFLLFLAGGLASSLELQDDLDNQWTSNQSYTNNPDGNTTSDQLSDYTNQTSNQSTKENPDKSGDNCSYWDVLQHLNLIKNKDMFTMIRPVKHHKDLTKVYIEMRIFAILDVREEDQSFISDVWILMEWENQFISWDREDFCGISEVEVPREALWMPDITIAEMAEKDKAQPSPYLRVYWDGWVGYMDDKFVISTCKMHIFYFPFDIQSCQITFKSISYSDEELIIYMDRNNERITKESNDTIKMQYEWEFLNITARSENITYFYSNRSLAVYNIIMKRKSSLYVINFLLPVLFFLILDFASLLMPTGSGEKISFKITVLLAVTVMQLILVEILPFTTSRIPLIVIYCIVVFALMLLSVLETMLMNYLMEKDSSSQEVKKKSDKLNIKNASTIASSCDEMTHQTASIYIEGSSSQLTELFLAVEKFSDELGEVKKTFLDKESEGKKDGYWTRVAKNIDKIFSIVYVLAAILFLTVLFGVWLSDYSKQYAQIMELGRDAD